MKNKKKSHLPLGLGLSVLRPSTAPDGQPAGDWLVDKRMPAHLQLETYDANFDKASRIGPDFAPY